METLRAPVLAARDFQVIENAVKAGNTPISVYGVNDLGRAMLADALGRKCKRRLFVTYSEEQAKKLYESYRFFDKQVYLYPAKDALFYSADVHSNTIVRKRLEIFKRLAENQPVTVVLTADALLDKLPDLSDIKKNRYLISKDATVQEGKLKKKLTEMGYEKKDWVDMPGQFAVRGGIVDIFPLTEECPYRIELWGDEIDSIRSFDVDSQRSIENVEELMIYPASEMVLSKERLDRGLKAINKEHKIFAESLKKSFQTESYARINREIAKVTEALTEFHGTMGVDSFIEFFYDNTVSFLDYFKENSMIFIDNNNRVREQAEACYQEFAVSMESRLAGGYILPTQTKVLYDVDALYSKLVCMESVVEFTLLESEAGTITGAKCYPFLMKGMPSYEGQLNNLIQDMKKWRDQGFRQLVISPSATRGKRLADNFERENIIAFYSEDKTRILAPREVMVTTGHLPEGFILEAAKLIVISESNMMTQKAVSRSRKRGKLYSGEQIHNFADLSIGDLVVHEQYGLGIYRGIETITVDDVEKDYISIEYAGDSKLYILCSQLECIQKYAAASDKVPKLNKLGGSEWSKTRNKVQSQIEMVAKELVELYAARQEKQGYPFSKDTVWQKEFEELFPFEETEDQIHAIEETKKDMESTRIMDRLICGDVGYGKTEIAIRAAFKAVLDSKQVAYLVPTTILAQQHYNSFVERMKDFPVSVRMLSRFCTTAQMKDTLRGLAKGEVDIVIGTHRLLSKDVEFKNLGLLIIDEEQRFGVSHKEKIKQLKKDVDVLTLTATPIPRTLHMSLIGIRDMSVLEEPPMDRRAVQTYVLEYNEELVKEAIARELARGGQVFYVYNRVTSIDLIASGLQELLPDARIAFAHGQMKERELENIMMSFIHGDIDVLVATTIIETGLDISNVNTMIIHDADKFGLSQLYQLRGRIGRSNRSSYAFLMYKRDKQITEVAEKRLNAIREFTDLGSGFKIAMRDLEIRGAGNLLGKAQSGHMAAVGYDLYCKMLNDEVMRQKGLYVEEKQYETMVDLPFDALIPATYVKNEFVKLGLYKRIANIETREDYEEMADELIDRFGDMPKETNHLLEIALLKAQAHKAYITEICIKRNHLRLEMYPQAALNTEGIPELVKKYRNQIKIESVPVPAFDIDLKKMSKREYLPFIQGVVSDIIELTSAFKKEA